MGAARGRPGGAPVAWVWGVRRRALSHARPPVLWGVRPGPTTQWLLVRGVQAWGPVTNPTARALARWLCALWGRREVARGGRLLPGCGVSGVGRSPTPDRPSFGSCSRGPLPTGCGYGGCGCGDPSPTPLRALLRDVISEVFHFCPDRKSILTVAAISRVQTEVAFKILSGSEAYMHAYTQVQGQTSHIVCLFIMQPH